MDQVEDNSMKIFDTNSNISLNSIINEGIDLVQTIVSPSEGKMFEDIEQDKTDALLSSNLIGDISKDLQRINSSLSNENKLDDTDAQENSITESISETNTVTETSKTDSPDKPKVVVEFLPPLSISSFNECLVPPVDSASPVKSSSKLKGNSKGSTKIDSSEDALSRNSETGKNVRNQNGISEKNDQKKKTKSKNDSNKGSNQSEPTDSNDQNTVIKLGDIDYIVSNVEKMTGLLVPRLHNFLYRTNYCFISDALLGKAKRNILSFKGFPPFENKMARFRKKCELKKFSDDDLVCLSKILVGKSFGDPTENVQQIWLCLKDPREFNQTRIKEAELLMKDKDRQLKEGILTGTAPAPIVQIEKLKGDNVESYLKPNRRKQKLSSDSEPEFTSELFSTPQTRKISSDEEESDANLQSNILKMSYTKPFYIFDGPGKLLKFFPAVVHGLGKVSEEIVSLLHQVLYGTTENDTLNRRNILEFNGFSLCQADFASNRKAILKSLSMHHLHSLCKIFSLKKSAPEKMINMLHKFLLKPSDDLDSNIEDDATPQTTAISEASTDSGDENRDDATPQTAAISEASSDSGDENQDDATPQMAAISEARSDSSDENQEEEIPQESPPLRHPMAKKRAEYVARRMSSEDTSSSSTSDEDYQEEPAADSDEWVPPVPTKRRQPPPTKKTRRTKQRSPRRTKQNPKRRKSVQKRFSPESVTEPPVVKKKRKVCQPPPSPVIMLRHFEKARLNIECAPPEDLTELNDLLFVKPSDETEIHERILNFTPFEFNRSSQDYHFRKTLLHYMQFNLVKKIGILLDIPYCEQYTKKQDLANSILNFLIDMKAFASLSSNKLKWKNASKSILFKNR